MLPQPSRIAPSPPKSYTRIQSERGHDDDIHQSNPTDHDNNDPSTDPNPGLQVEKTEPLQPARTFSRPSASAPTSPSSSNRSTLYRTRCNSSPSPRTYYKHSLPHRRVLRSFPRLPHAFAQPSPNRYFPYIPISITVSRTVERDLISDTEKEQEARLDLNPVIPSVAAHDGPQEEVEGK